MSKSRSIAAGLIAAAAAALTLVHVAGQAATQSQEITEQPAPASTADLPTLETPVVIAEAVAPIAEEPIGPEAQEAAAEPEPLAPMTIVAEAADGYIVFVEDAEDSIEGASAWPAAKLEALVGFYEEAVALYTGEAGFGSTERWAAAFGISRGNPIRVVYAGNRADPAPARAGWVQGTAVITHYTLRTSVRTAGVQLLLHELAHIWDNAHDWELGEAIISRVDNPDDFPTAKAQGEGPKEDFAESVAATLWPGYAVNDGWSDNEAGQGGATSDTLEAVRMFDRCDYVESLF